MKTIIVTAANESFAPLLQDLLQSLHQWGAPLADAIGVLDLGLSDATLRSVQEQASHVVTPSWDLPFDQALRESRPHLRAMASRPFLPRHFPGYDCYLWLDADVWVQDRRAIDRLFQAASVGAIAMVPEENRHYVQHQSSRNWRSTRLRNYFGDDGIRLQDANRYYNSGVFALRADAPHWDSWARHFRAALANYPLAASDQTVLNYAIWRDGLPIEPLPASCNWCCHLALPSMSLETGELCEPGGNDEPLGIIHLTANMKDWYCYLENAEKKFAANLRFRGVPPQGAAYKQRYVRF